MLPAVPSKTLIFASLVKINNDSSACLTADLVPERLGLFKEPWVVAECPFQIIAIMGEIELDIPSVKNKTDDEETSSTAI